MLWHYLETVDTYTANGSASDRADPWESQDELVQGIWRAITDPANEELLKVPYDMREGCNERARRCFERAWDEMMERKKLDGGTE